jgi:two-component system sensor histidine kinase BaeS
VTPKIWLRRLSWPSSYRGRIALVIAVALLVVTIGVQGVVRGVVNERVRAEAQQTLQDQAGAIAVAVDAAPEAVKRDRAADAARYLPDTRILVTWPSPGGVYYNLVPLVEQDAEATATSGEVVVKLQRGTRLAGLSDWLVVGLFVVGLGLTAALIWGLASALARRLRHQAADLAASAEAVAAGDLAVRAEVTDDELGRAAGAFNQMAERLAAADERQRRFLADVAHELRTPVTAIDGFAEALAEGTATDPADQREAVGFIRDEAARLRALIGDLRELTWLDLDPPPRRTRIDLAATARDTVARLSAEAVDAGVELTGPGGAVAVESDPAYIQTILANLITNAIAATPRGGRVDVRGGRDAATAWLEVADGGSGIASEHLPHIFDRLYRVDTARSREHGGSGLGLAIVKRLADLLGGEVSVVSAPGEGATFTVRLPVDVEAAAARGAGAAIGAPPA